MGAELFAGVRVRDYEAALPWYERLLGEPAFFPNETEAVWTVADGGSVYIVEDAERAGGSLLMIMVEYLDAAVAEVADRGLLSLGGVS